MSEARIYEIVDCTDEEQYYPLGVWLWLTDAISALDECADPDDINTDGCHWDNDFFRVEIREHRVGWSGHGKAVYTRAWAKEYDEAKDEYVWKAVRDA